MCCTHQQSLNARPIVTNSKIQTILKTQVKLNVTAYSRNPTNHFTGSMCEILNPDRASGAMHRQVDQQLLFFFSSVLLLLFLKSSSLPCLPVCVFSASHHVSD